MNGVLIGRHIEDHIKARYQLKESQIGFDGNLNGLEIEIKGCMPIHKNGVNPNGTDRVTKGRFWIDNDAHRILLERRGFYIFVVYYMSGAIPTIIEYQYMSAWAVNKLINSGDNTKIRYDRIFSVKKG